MPVPLLLAAGPLINTIGGAVSYGQQKKYLEGVRSDAQTEAKKAEQAAQRIRSNMSFAVGDVGRQAYMRSQQDIAGDIARREAERAAASGIGALQSGGAKALIGGSAGMAGAQQRMLATAAAESQARKAAGEQMYSGLEEGMRGEQRQMQQFDYGRQLGLGDQARQTEFSAEGQLAAAKQNLTQDLFSAASGATGALGAGLGPEMDPEQMKLMQAMLGSAEKGAKVKQTPGEFSHKTNPIHLVRNGAKVGEVTGGELIFNPEQAGKIETMASEGDTPLHKYLRGLFKKFNSK